jgi:hypothetical protein
VGIEVEHPMAERPRSPRLTCCTFGADGTGYSRHSDAPHCRALDLRLSRSERPAGGANVLRVFGTSERLILGPRQWLFVDRTDYLGSSRQQTLVVFGYFGLSECV